MQNDSVASADPGKVAEQATNLLYTGEHFDTDAQQYYLRARWYNPNNGLFNQTDPFAGSPQDPQSLHKYLYCHANPVNGIDPSGRNYAMSLPELNIAMAIGALVIACVIAGTVLNPTWRRAAEKTFEDFLKMAIALVAFAMMPLKDGWRWIKEQWERVKNHFKDREGVYLHYSFRSQQASLIVLGLWDIQETFCTRTPYPIGWLAKWFLALPHADPPNAVYIVWPRKGFGHTTEGYVPAKPDDLGRMMGGGGYQYVFAKGSGGPGTVFGPVRIPEGSLEDVQNLKDLWPF